MSSYKFGFGADCLTDGDPETFWQYVPLALLRTFSSCNTRSSDGPQPHFVTIEFPRKMAVQVRSIPYFPLSPPSTQRSPPPRLENLDVPELLS